jgi:vacuolar protein sorting-associated protein 54
VESSTTRSLDLGYGPFLFSYPWTTINAYATCRSGLGEHIRKMGQLEFLTLIRSIYKSLLSCVEGLQSQGSVIVDVFSGLQSVNLSHRSTSSFTHAMCRYPSTSRLQEELSDILSSAAELCNTRAASIISLRSEEHAALDLPDFLEFFSESWSFVVKCEVICRRMIVGLRGVVAGQVSATSYLVEGYADC